MQPVHTAKMSPAQWLRHSMYNQQSRSTPVTQVLAHTKGWEPLDQKLLHLKIHIKTYMQNEPEIHRQFKKNKYNMSPNKEVQF